MENNEKRTGFVTPPNAPLEPLKNATGFYALAPIVTVRAADGSTSLEMVVRRDGNYVYTIIERTSVLDPFYQPKRIYDDISYVRENSIAAISEYLSRMFSVYKSRRNLQLCQLTEQSIVTQLMMTAFADAVREKK